MSALARPIRAALQKAKRPLLPSLTALLLMVWCGNTARATVITCTNGGNWSVAANWSPNLVPGSGDDVYMTNHTVTLDVSPTVASLALTGGSLGGAGSLTVNGPFVWSGGQITSVVTLNGTSSLDGVGGGSMTLIGRLINAGALTWSGSGANLNFNNQNGTLTNLASGTITITADVSTANASPGTIGNAGLITKTNTTGTTTFGEFVNTGTLNIQSGTINLVNNGTESGIIGVASGATLNFTGGTHSVNAGFSASGPGSFLINGATVDFNDAVGSTVPNLTLTNGILGGSGLLAVNGPFVWSGGQIRGVVTLNGTSSLDGVGGGSMTLIGHLSNAGALTWSGSGANLNFNNQNGTLTNLASGTITITADVSTANASPGTIGNAGLITKTNTTGTTTFGEFVNTGTLNIQSGTINLVNNGTESGIIGVASGATLNFTGGTHSVNAGFSASGPGSFLINGATVDFNDAVGSTVPNLTLTNGILGGSGLLAVNGPFVWSGGQIRGVVTLNGTSSLDGVGGGSMTLIGHLSNAGALTWSGSGANLNFNNQNGTLTNLASGTITITADVSTASASPGTIGNAGLITKTNTTGTTTFGEFVNTGTLNIQSGTIDLTGNSVNAGTVNVPSGTINSSASFVNSGTLNVQSGTTNSLANCVNSGILNVQSGTVDLTGSSTLGGGVLSFGINSATDYGKINLSGVTSAQRNLAVNLNGFYWPTVGSSFDLLTYTSESGAFFTNTVLPAFITWQTNYNPTVFTLSVVARQTNSAPTNLTMSVAGNTNLNLAWPGDHTGWRLEAQTNSLQVGLSTDWAIVPGSGLTNEMTFPIGLANGAVFFRLMHP